MKMKDMLEMSDEQRYRLRPFKKRRKYIYERRKFSQEELIGYLRKNNFTSAGKLETGRKPGEPRVYDYKKEFGKWENARSAAFGIMEIDCGVNAKYILRAVIEYNLWTAKAYRAIHNKEPSIFPSLHRVLKKWGGKWSIVVGAAKQLSFKSTLDEYKKLWNKLGHTPSMEEVNAEGISLESVLRYYKTKKAIDDVIKTWEIVNERETGSS